MAKSKYRREPQATKQHEKVVSDVRKDIGNVLRFLVSSKDELEDLYYAKKGSATKTPRRTIANTVINTLERARKKKIVLQNALHKLYRMQMSTKPDIKKDIRDMYMEIFRLGEVTGKASRQYRKFLLEAEAEIFHAPLPKQYVGFAMLALKDAQIASNRLNAIASVDPKVVAKIITLGDVRDVAIPIEEDETGELISTGMYNFRNAQDVVNKWLLPQLTRALRLLREAWESLYLIHDSIYRSEPPIHVFLTNQQAVPIHNKDKREIKRLEEQLRKDLQPEADASNAVVKVYFREGIGKEAVDDLFLSLIPKKSKKEKEAAQKKFEKKRVLPAGLLLSDDEDEVRQAMEAEVEELTKRKSKTARVSKEEWPEWLQDPGGHLHSKKKWKPVKWEPTGGRSGAYVANPGSLTALKREHSKIWALPI